MPYPAKTGRDAILAVAVEQLEQGGLAQLSLRSVASQLGVVPNALYRYFADRSRLESALSSEGARTLLEVLRKAAGKKSPERAIRAMAAAYLQFAREQRAMHEVMILRCDRSHEDAQAHRDLWQYFLGHVAGVAGKAHASEAAVALWAFLLGMAQLESAEVFSEEKPLSSFQFGLDAWFRASRKH